MRVIFSYIICHLISYFIVSIPYYHFVMKDFYNGSDPVFQKFLITENQHILWHEAMNEVIPIQLMSAFLYSILLLLVFDWLKDQTYFRFLFFIFWTKGIVGGIISASPAPGNLEGILFLSPEITLKIHFLVLIEILLQAILVSLLFHFFYVKLWEKSK